MHLTGSQLHHSRNPSEIYDHSGNDVDFKKMGLRSFGDNIKSLAMSPLSKEDARDKLKYNL